MRKIDAIKSTKSLPSPKPNIPTKLIAPKNMIRTDSKQQKLDMFIKFSKTEKSESNTDKDSVCLCKLHSFCLNMKIFLPDVIRTYSNVIPKLFSFY